MSLERFYKSNMKKRPTSDIKYIASEYFTDEEDKPIEWILRPISGRELIATQQRSMNVENGFIDSAVMILNLLAQTVVYPDLSNAELQDSFGVNNPHDLLNEMLTLEEYVKLTNKIEDIYGNDDRNLQQMVENAKK